MHLEFNMKDSFNKSEALTVFVYTGFPVNFTNSGRSALHNFQVELYAYVLNIQTVMVDL